MGSSGRSPGFVEPEGSRPHGTGWWITLPSDDDDAGLYPDQSPALLLFVVSDYAFSTERGSR